MDAKTAAAPERLTFRTKFLYGFGSISFGVHVTFFSLLLFFYNQVVGLSAQMVSLALAISLVLDAAWDPVLGQISDGLRSRWGRRHPLMYLSAIPVAASVVALWHPPGALDAAGKFVWLLSFVLIARLVISLYEVPSQALAPELAPDYHDRTVLMSYRWVFYTLGGAVASSLGFFVFFRPTAQYPQGQLNPAAWGPLAITSALIMAGSILLSAWGTHDRIPGLHKPAARKVGLLELAGEVMETLSNWNLGVAVGASLIAGVGYALFLGLALYIDTFFWGLSANDVGLLTLANLAAVIPGAWLANALARRVGKKRACIGVFLTSVVLLQGPILMRLLHAFPANGSAAFLPLLVGVRFGWGVLNNAGYIVVTSMVADITEDAQVKTGRRAEGLLMAVNTFITKVTAGLSAILPGLLLAFVGFPAKATASVDQAIVHRFVWVYLPATTVLSLGSIMVWMFYRIDQATHERNLATVREAQALAEIHAERAGEAGAAAVARAAV